MIANAEILIALLIGWTIVMVVGHGSWVILRTMFRLLAGIGKTDAPSSAWLGEKADIAATRRVIGRLTRHDLIDGSVATELRDQLRNLEAGRTGNAIGSLPRHELASDTVRPQTTKTESTQNADLPVEPDHALVQPPVHAGHPPVTDTVEQTGDAEPILAVLADTPIADDDFFPPPRQEGEPETAAPVLSKSEVIQSFLAAHNIRWGELVAGMLIVICSIGLVISLWNTLVQTHRVIPSMIFLGANAAIYAAGLYTLSRWRLRHTSRAVLVIATLLVPLSVLAGLAAAGTGVNAVQLNDPITLVAIALAAVIYTGLLYRSSTALSRRPYAVPMAMSVAGPVSVLPLVPAAVRTFGSNAGWIVGLGSIAVLIATFLINRLHKRSELSLGIAGGRTRLLVVAFGIFSLAVSIGYVAFALRANESTAMLPIGIAAIPAMLALAATSRSVMIAARNQTQSMISAVCCVLLIGLACTVLPPSMTAASWLWSWALAFSTSAAFVGWFFRLPRWLPLATMPVGIAATFSSPVWLGDQTWATVGLTGRLIGGEPMITATLMAIAVAALTQVIKDPIRRHWMGIGAIVWTVLALAIATALSIAPAAKLGVAPWWSVTLVLMAGMVGSFVASTRHRLGSYATIGTAAFGWLSVMRPIRWGESLADVTPKTWMATFIAIAATMLVLRELAPRVVALVSSSRKIMRRSNRDWEVTAGISAVIAGLIACGGVRQGWVSSGLTLAIASALLLWVSTLSRSVGVLRVSQLSTVALAIVVGYGRFAEWLFAHSAWQNSIAPWAWAITSASVALLWLAIRQVVVINRAPLRKRFRVLRSPKSLPSRMPDGWINAIAAGFIVFATALTFTRILTQAASIEFLVSANAVWLPIAAFTVCAATSWLTPRFEGADSKADQHGLSDRVSSSLIVAGILWTSCQLGRWIGTSADAELVAATSLAAAGCFALSWLIPGKFRPVLPGVIRFHAMVTGLLVAALSSGVLLLTGWLDPILDANNAEAFPTLSVASWWLLAAAGLLWDSRNSTSSVPSIASALLTSAAAATVVPVYFLSHPVVWIQVGAIAALAWKVVCQRWLDQAAQRHAWPAIHGASWFAAAVGLTTAILVTLSIVFNARSLHPFFGFAGLIVSFASVALCCLGRLPKRLSSAECYDRLPWPIGLSILAGQITWVTYWLGLVSGVHVIELVPAVWAVAAAASLLRYRADATVADFVHVVFVCVATTIIAGMLGFRSQWMPWLAMGVLSIGGILVAFVGGGPTTAKPLAIASRILGWFVVGSGVFLLVTQITSGPNPHVQWTAIILWPAIWLVAWRLLCPDTREATAGRREAFLAIPDIELAGLLLLAAAFEVILFALSGQHRYQTNVIADPLLWTRMVAYVAVGCTAPARGSRTAVWTCGIGTLVAVTSLATVETAIHFGATSNQRFMWAAVPAGFAIAFIAHWLPALSRLLSRLVDEPPAAHLARLVQATWQVAVVVAGIGGIFAAAMIFSRAPGPETQITIITVALAAWAIAEMAQACDSSRLRHAAVTTGLITIGLWASVDSGETAHRLLSGSMRWLVASVFTIPMLLFVFPRLLGESITNHWRKEFHRGALVAGCAAGVSLISMLVMEALLRRQGGIEGISWPMVIGVAVTLSILSALAGFVAILSGPGSTWRERIVLSDQQRMWLIIAAQVIAAIACLHVFLCKNWSFFGLRAYWPYIVMALAFLSVGATQWARRREDEVMSRTLSQTAFYLPLIPVVGFWLSGSMSEFAWVFQGGRVRYDLLLAVGSVYYIGISALWKQAIPRITAVVLGNAAWWVVLVQQPGWSFLAHPQAWLIPPAACVLVVTHLYRDRLEPAVSSGIRYAATLVIYISSTADILLQQIGTNIFGPIVLILLALFGMAAGVVLRVRPFLYLGALFVFVGVTSMVWHAHKSIDAVWPWWVFGITTGICLLGGLMAIEKNKPKLREYANSLSTWQG